MDNPQSELKFKVSSQIKNIVGKDLISDDNIAVFELVKNSFDAHSKKVKIIFEPEKIIIWDDGKGMDKDDIINKWLFLAYSAKKEGDEDIEFSSNEFEDYRNKIRPKKYYAGAKGVGRFSTDKLGEKLTLTTRKISESFNTFHQLEFYWKKFEENPTLLFQDIEIDYKELQEAPIPDFKHGVILEISSLRSNWGRKQMLDLKKSLEKLINPVEEGTDDYDFDIEIICEREKEKDSFFIERDRVNGKVKNFIFETLEIKTTQVQSEIKANKIRTSLFDRGNLVYEIEEANSYDHIQNARIRIFYLNHSAKLNFKNSMGIESVRFGHIFLFNNGFRVYPYGETNFDPLGIDRRKAQGRARFLGTREMVGRIELWNNSVEEFQEKSSRDGGLKDTLGKKEMEEYYFETLKKLERYVAPILWGITKRSGNSEENLDLQSKKQIIDLIVRLAGSKNIELIKFGQEVIDIFNESIENQSDEDFDRLIEIAQKTNNQEFEQEVILAKKRYFDLLREKEHAEQLQREEEEKRLEAEFRAKEEEQKRLEAEQKTKEEEEKRLLAEQRAKEEEYKRLKAEEEARESREKAALEEQLRKQKESQVRFLESVSSLDITDVLNLNHQIGIDANTIKNTLINFQNKFTKEGSLNLNDAENYINRISLATEKILSVVNYTTKANFMAATLETEADIIGFYRNYIYTILNQHLGKDITINIDKIDSPFIRKFKPIDLTIIIDNLVSNSRKKHAKNVFLSFENLGEKLCLTYRDDGTGLDPKIANPQEIFQRGYTTTRGSGLGMFHIKNILTEMKSTIYVDTKVESGIEFKINFSK
ncbi:sensor histidine kinase [Haliscomenobacter sp.]|uniref:sensor histidine kinase n=1 Tax=Haliscomenobacter sp. TaxID=2717303 RepID=UPI003BACBFEF